MAIRGDLSPEDLKKRAEQVGLDLDQFSTCSTSGAKEVEIQDAMAGGQALGVTGTPSYFINGRMMVGAVPYEQLKAVVDEELALLQGETAKSDG
jgi:protein-disulfide isomerase